MTRALLLGALLALAPARAALAQDVKLGYVDLKRAVAETEDGRRATATLKKDFEQKQKELDERQEELKKEVDDLEKKRTLLPANTVREKEMALQKKLQDVQQMYMRHQQSLQQKENEALGKIIDRMQRIIFKISSTENFTMVFDKNGAGVVFAKPHLDLTNEVIRRYNSGEGNEGGGKAPAAGKKGAPPPATTKK